MQLPTAGLTRDEFLDLFLESDDFPKPMWMAQDTRDRGPEPGVTAFPKNQGLFAGFSVWMSKDEWLWYLVDVRWAFPSAAKAEAFHLERIEANSEGRPPIRSAKTVGQQCYVFGGAVSLPPYDLRMNQYYYIFRVHNIVVKLYLGSDDTQLKIDTVAKIARRIESRINERAY